MAGYEKKDHRLSGLRYENLRSGNHDGAERLKDMEIDGVYASVIYRRWERRSMCTLTRKW
jgi:hypothetical protein